MKTIAATQGQTPFQKFKQLMERLLTVPEEEIDEKQKEYERKKERKKKKTGKKPMS